MDKKHKQSSLQTKISKIDWLNQNAWTLRVNDSIRAFELSKEAISLSGKIRYEKGEAKGLRTFGFSHIRFTKYHEALSNEVEIRIKDNGTGIPDSVKVKIFQPFFTTKPTGQGTGLGLSLAYDIVTKGHSGTMEVESEEGRGTEFVIRLPDK